MRDITSKLLARN